MRFNYKEDLSRKYIQKNKEEGSHSNMKRNNLQVNWPNKDNHQQGERIQTPVLVKRLGYQLTIFSTKHGTSHSPRHPTKCCLPHTGAYRAKFIDAVAFLPIDDWGGHIASSLVTTTHRQFSLAGEQSSFTGAG